MTCENPKHLYTPKDVSEVRKKLWESQDKKDAVTGVDLEFKDSVTDHDHQTQFVRAILHRQVNSFIGKLENNFIRMIRWWYKGTLPEFLRQCADYLEKNHPREYLHPAWMKRCQTDYNKLPSEASKRSVLIRMGSVDGKNGTERKKLFRGLLMSRKFSFSEIQQILKEEMQNGV